MVVTAYLIINLLRNRHSEIACTYRVRRMKAKVGMPGVKELKLEEETIRRLGIRKRLSSEVNDVRYDHVNVGNSSASSFEPA